MGQLYLVVLVAGLLTMVFDVTHMSFLPALVTRDQLVEGNSKLQTTFSLAYVLGPGLAGGLVALVTAPLAIAVDAVSFLVSALFISLIHVTGTAPRALSHRASVRRDIGAGLRTVFGTPVLRAIALYAGTHFLFVSAIISLLVLYASRDLGVPPALIGVIFAAVGVGYLLGAVLGRRVARHLGLGLASVGGAVLNGLAVLLIPVAGGHGSVSVALLVASQLLLGMGIMVNDVAETSLRQALTPDRLRGRVNATIRVAAWGPSLVGALLGGVLGQAIGPRLTLLAMGLGLLCAPLWLILSPIPSLREPPTPIHGTVEAV
jgi:MFS family permease